MTPKKTHDQCRDESCCCCGGRVKPGNVNEKLQERVRKWAKPEWYPSILSYPTGVCCSCRRRLLDCEKMGSRVAGVKWDAFQLQNISVPRGQLAETCVCDICKARRYRVGQPGAQPTTLKNKKIKTTGESTEAGENVSHQTRCVKCLQVTGRGIPHPCTQGTRKRNLVELVGKQGNDELEQVAAAIVKKVATDENGKLDEEIQLKQLNGGQKLRVKIDPKASTSSRQKKSK